MTKKCREKKKKKCLSFPPQEFQTSISSLRAPDCFLLLWDAGLINRPRNWLSQYQEVTSANKFYPTKLNTSIPFYTKWNTESCFLFLSFFFFFCNPTTPNIKWLVTGKEHVPLESDLLSLYFSFTTEYCSIVAKFLYFPLSWSSYWQNVDNNTFLTDPSYTHIHTHTNKNM